MLTTRNIQQLKFITSSISCVRHHFIDIFARNDLPENICCYLIVNTKSFRYSGYWIAVLFLNIIGRPGVYMVKNKINHLVIHNSLRCVYIEKTTDSIFRPWHICTICFICFSNISFRLNIHAISKINVNENDDAIKWYFWCYYGFHVIFSMSHFATQTLQ